LNSNSNKKTCNKFWIQNSNSNLKLYFMSWTWAHTLHLTLVYNTVVHLNLHRAQTKYLRWHSKLGFFIRVTHHRNTFNLGNVNLVELMPIIVNLIMNALQCIWWHGKLLVTITQRCYTAQGFRPNARTLAAPKTMYLLLTLGKAFESWHLRAV
jgi:hypothetical protein